ncbi:hypothetical protein H5410_015225 [Solanum commersonii]|uniref:Uncharacterized protein n=1 Tax=Solanum commersonii TaxID=4109 RepID=A0A9J5ZT76_SOLCO|nr:hypothetical protein H5410_015225 [Solanum commersonii]
MWRIYEFNLTEMQSAVINLQLHLIGKQAEKLYEFKMYSLNNMYCATGRSKIYKLLWYQILQPKKAKESGLLESDNNISECLRHVVSFKMPTAL